MEQWLEIAGKLTLDVALVIAVVMLWRKSEAQSAETKELHKARLDDLKAILRPDD